jgi:hypothetical protein
VAVFAASDLVHPFDQAARQRLECCPPLAGAVEAFAALDHGRSADRDHAADRDQTADADVIGDLRARLEPICAGFGITPPRIELVTGDAGPVTVGLDDPVLVLSAGLVGSAGPDELTAALARECGHLFLGYGPHRSLHRALIADGDAVPGLAPDDRAAVRAALADWYGMSELSADRAAAAYLGNADAVTELIFRLAGTRPTAPGRDAAGRDADALRVREIQAWAATPGFARVAGMWVFRSPLPARADRRVSVHL